MYVCMYICIHSCICMYICVCVHVCICVCINMYVVVYMCKYACMYLHVYVYLYVGVYLHVCVYITENMTTLINSCLLCGMWHLCQSMAFLTCPSLLFEEPILLCPAPSNGAQGCWQARRWGPGDTVSACGDVAGGK